MEQLSEKQQLFLDKVHEGKSLFLTGKAGTGKSYIVKRAIQELQEKRKNVVALAPTGVAANNIGGQTLHSFFQLNPFGVLDFAVCNFMKGEKRRLIQQLDTIFIDEVSMLRPDLLDGINWTLLKNGCKPLKDIQIIFIGDLKQLPAPIDDNMRSVLMRTYEGDQFHFAQTYPYLHVETIELDEVHRQTDPDFIENLNIVRDGMKSEYFRQFVTGSPRGIILAPHNSTVQRYNIAGLNQIEQPELTFTASIEGNVKAADFNLESEIKVKHGAKIMYLANSKNNNLINGTLGIFVSRNENYFIDVEGVEYALEPLKFSKKEYVLNERKNDLELRELGSITQYPIKLAYALTIHKSQGLTFDEVTVDLSLPCFQNGQLYTALSRVKSPRGLTIIVNR